MMEVLGENLESFRDLQDCLEQRIVVLPTPMTAKEAVRFLSNKYNCSCQDCNRFFETWLPSLRALVDELEPINSDRLAKLLESWTNIRKKLREANAS